jgi:hypothetical protein
MYERSSAVYKIQERVVGFFFDYLPTILVFGLIFGIAFVAIFVDFSTECITPTEHTRLVQDPPTYVKVGDVMVPAGGGSRTEVLYECPDKTRVCR